MLVNRDWSDFSKRESFGGWSVFSKRESFGGAGFHLKII